MTTSHTPPAGTHTKGVSGVGAPGTPESQSLTQRWTGALANNYGTPSVELVSGRGAQLRGSDGKEYIDLLGGIAVNALGHGHPAIIDAVTRQLSSLGHVSNLYIAEPPVALAEKLLGILASSTPAEVMFCNSGTEANEAALKVSRLTGRPRIISMEGGFHGRTMGSLAVTGQPAKRAPFEPLPGGVEFVPYGDADALKNAIDRDPASVAAVIVEPIQGEAGVVMPPADYLAQVRTLTTAAGALMIVDEVQTGIGRTGHWFYSRSQGIEPDIITLAKGLGGGLPIGAVLLSGKAYGLLKPGMHGSTFGGNTIAAAAALAVLETIETTQMLAEIERKGKELRTAIENLDHQLIDHTRGEGLLIGVGLTQAISPKVEASAREHGFLLNAPRPDTIRLAPPLIINDEQLNYFVSELPGILDDALKGTES